MEDQPIVQGVDHLTVRVSQPEPLFKAFTEQLLLPVAWPLTTNPFFTSGAVHLGNLNLEVMQISQQTRPARLFGLALDLLPFDASLPELDRRGILHSPPMPFYLIDDQNWQVTAFNTVYLGGLISDSRTARLFFNLSQRAPKERWEQGSFPRPFNRQFGMPFIYDRVYRRGMVQAVAYNPAWRAANIKEEPALTGLEVLQVFEVTIGAVDIERALACWKALLDLHPEVAPGVWKLPDGMHIRVVHSPREGFRRMVWQVASLNRALQFLHKRDLLGKEKDGMPTIDSHQVQGLDIRLVQ